jgi:hypothetical protein
MQADVPFGSGVKGQGVAKTHCPGPVWSPIAITLSWMGVVHSVCNHGQEVQSQVYWRCLWRSVVSRCHYHKVFQVPLGRRLDAFVTTCVYHKLLPSQQGACFG